MTKTREIPYALVLLATRVQQLITERGLSQADVARGIGKSSALLTQLLNAIEHPDEGKRVSRVSLDVIDDLATYFEIPHASLFVDPKTAPALTLRPAERAFIEALRDANTNTRRAIALILGLDQTGL